MKKLLIVGNSLTAGHPGVGFVHALAKAKCPYQVIADGRGGDTLLGISQRLVSLLGRHAPDVVIMEAGVNDLLLPWFRTRGAPWKKLADRLERRGSIPTTQASLFQSLYTETIATAKQRSAVILVTTITPLGEDVNSRLNRQREQYNAAICRLAKTCDAHPVEVGQAFDDALRAAPTLSAYLLDDYNNLYLDTLLSPIASLSDVLSKQRRLLLTVDGVHLNRRGAQMYAKMILEELAHLDI